MLLLAPYWHVSKYVAKFFIEYSLDHSYYYFTLLRSYVNPYVPPILRKQLTEDDFVEL